MNDFVGDVQPWPTALTNLSHQGGWEMPGQSWLWNPYADGRQQQSELTTNVS